MRLGDPRHSVVRCWRNQIPMSVDSEGVAAFKSKQYNGHGSKASEDRTGWEWRSYLDPEGSGIVKVAAPSAG